LFAEITAPLTVATRALRWIAIGCLLGAALVLAACSSKAPDGPNSALQPFKRGVQAYQDEDYPHAARMFEQAAKLDDNNPVVYYNLGLAYYQLEAFPEAIEAYHKALKLDPKMADAEMNLALAYDRTYDLELANAHYNEYLALVRARKPKAEDTAQAGAPGKGAAGAGAAAGTATAAGTAKPAKPVLGGQALSSLPGGPQPKKPGEPALQPGRSRPGPPPVSGRRAPVGELRRMPADDGRTPSSKSSKDPNSSQSNEWWTQGIPSRTR
jgi:tetratricopeptide (TPR) repeat protein